MTEEQIRAIAQQEATKAAEQAYHRASLDLSLHNHWGLFHGALFFAVLGALTLGITGKF